MMFLELTIVSTQPSTFISVCVPVICILSPVPCKKKISKLVEVNTQIQNNAYITILILYKNGGSGKLLLKTENYQKMAFCLNCIVFFYIQSSYSNCVCLKQIFNICSYPCVINGLCWISSVFLGSCILQLYYVVYCSSFSRLTKKTAISLLLEVTIEEMFTRGMPL